MPSYRYTREIKPEDLQPDTPPELEGKEKAKNWWHYHRVWVLVGAIVLLLVVFFVRDIVTKVEPDYKLGVMAPYDLPDSLKRKMEEGLAAYLDDLNGDGRVEVMVEVYTIAEAGKEEGTASFDTVPGSVSGGDAGAAAEGDIAAQMQDPYTQMAGVVRLTAAFEECNPVLFLLDAELAQQYQDQYQLLGADGQMVAEGAQVEELAVPFSQIPGLAEMDLTFELYEGEVADGHQLLDNYLVGTRAYYGTRMETKKGGPELWDYTRQLMERLLVGSPE